MRHVSEVRVVEVGVEDDISDHLHGERAGEQNHCAAVHLGPIENEQGPAAAREAVHS